jgi:hypothetical protein
LLCFCCFSPFFHTAVGFFHHKCRGNAQIRLPSRRISGARPSLSSFEQSGVPGAIIVADETAVEWNPKPKFVYAKKGQKRVLLQTEDKRSTTALMAAKVELTWRCEEEPGLGLARAVASHLPSTLVFAHRSGSGKQLLAKLNDSAARINRNGESQIRVTSSKKGWVNAPVMEEWIDTLPKGGTRPTWLVFDSFSAHVGEGVEQRCAARNIMPFVIPGGCLSPTL